MEGEKAPKSRPPTRRHTSSFWSTAATSAPCFSQVNGRPPSCPFSSLFAGNAMSIAGEAVAPCEKRNRESGIPEKKERERSGSEH